MAASGSRSRLRQAERHELSPLADPTHDGVGDLGPAMRHQDRAHERAHKLHVGYVQVRAGNRLDHDTGCDAIDAKTTDGFWQLRRDQSELAHLPDQRPVELALALPRGVARCQLLSGKAAGSVAHRFVFRAQIEFHDSASPGTSWWRRSEPL